ncbi:MAG: hypothetical protein AAF720_06220 [Pseudomonadota bacterium]
MRDDRKSLCLLLSVITACFSAFSTAHAGPGDLLVSPVRVVFEGRQRVAEVTLVNKSEQAATYRLSVENRRMRRDGSFEVIEVPGDGDLFAEKYVRYAPRRVTLEPNAPQTIRLMARKPADLKEGEYRSHLVFAAVPKEAGANSIENQSGDERDISIRLTPVYGVTIPMIVRHGSLSASAEIRDLQFTKDNENNGAISFILARDGTKSIYGDISLHLAGEKAPLIERRGIAVYVPNKERLIELPVGQETLAQIKGRDVEVHFEERAAIGQPIVAEFTLALQ